MLYQQTFLLQNPPSSVKDLEVWKYVVNKMTNSGQNEIKIAGAIKYYQTKINFLKRNG